MEVLHNLEPEVLRAQAHAAETLSEEHMQHFMTQVSRHPGMLSLLTTLTMLTMLVSPETGFQKSSRSSASHQLDKIAELFEISNLRDGFEREPRQFS